MLAGSRLADDDAVDPARERLDDGLALQPGEALAGAAVDAVAERQQVDRVALDEERVGVLVVARVAVASADQSAALDPAGMTTPSISTSLVTVRPHTFSGAQ